MPAFDSEFSVNTDAHQINILITADELKPVTPFAANGPVAAEVNIRPGAVAKPKISL
jgi:hypothetical protein